MAYSSLGAQVCHVLTRDHTVSPATHTFIHKWNEPYLPLLPSRTASPHFGRYSFPVPLRVGGWVDLGWLGEILRWFARPKTVTHPSISSGDRESKSRPSSRESNAVTTRPAVHPVSAIFCEKDSKNTTKTMMMMMGVRLRESCKW